MIIDTIADSGLRGRGGAGFPTGVKWRTVAEEAAISGIAPRVVVNAAEGEPGSFKDRLLLERNPYRVLEGALIAAHAVGATEIVFAVKSTFTTVIDRLGTAIGELAGAGLTADVRVRIVTGPEQYLFGEETAMLEVIAGQAAAASRRASLPSRRATERRRRAPDGRRVGPVTGRSRVRCW